MEAEIPFSGSRTTPNVPVKVVLTGLELSGCSVLMERLSDTLKLPLDPAAIHSMGMAPREELGATTEGDEAFELAKVLTPDPRGLLSGCLATQNDEL